MVIAVTQAALSGWEYLFITEFTRAFFTDPGSYPIEKILVLQGGPHLPQINPLAYTHI